MMAQVALLINDPIWIMFLKIWAFWFVLAMATWGGIGKMQRLWVLKRDSWRCQFREYDGEKWVQCKERVPRNLHVHHVLPQRWMKYHLSHRDPHRPNNLITLCKKHHNGANGIHPDMDKALIEYRKGNKASFEDTMKGRQKLTEHGEIYWNPQFDWMLSRIARILTASFSRKEKYPEKRRRKDWKPPKRGDK